MTGKAPKRQRDANQLAKAIVDLATAESTLDSMGSQKDPNAVALGRKVELKGGKARADKLTPEQRVEIARLAAAARWKKNGHYQS